MTTTQTIEGATYETPFRSTSGTAYPVGTWLTVVDFNDGDGPFVTVAGIDVLTAFAWAK